MNLTNILLAVAIIGGVGLFIGLFLGFASRKFHVYKDEREEEVLAALPGNNCGGCGYAGCANLAEAIVKGEAPADACPVGGEAVAKDVASIMGIDAGSSIRMTAFVKCGGTKEKVKTDYEYFGVQSCKMAAFVPNGGPRACKFGCLGYGDCVKVCPFDAIHIVDGIAVVDSDACKACNKCVLECPKNIIELVPYESKQVVKCSSQDKGPVVMKICEVGCIACGICKKVCPVDAVTVENFIAYIDQEKCIQCGACSEKCPKKVITMDGMK